MAVGVLFVLLKTLCTALSHSWDLLYTYAHTRSDWDVPPQVDKYLWLGTVEALIEALIIAGLSAGSTCL